MLGADEKGDLIQWSEISLFSITPPEFFSRYYLQNATLKEEDHKRAGRYDAGLAAFRIQCVLWPKNAIRN